MGAAGPADATDICFRPTSSVTGATVTLKDVATISGADAATAARLGQTLLGPAPASGRNLRLEFEEIRSRLEATGLSTADASFSGSTVVVVSCTQPVFPVVRQPKTRTRVNVSQTQVRRAEKIMTQSVRQSLRGKSREAGNLFLDVIVDPSDVPIVLACATEGFELGALDPRNGEPQCLQVRTQNSRGQSVRFQIQCVVSQKPRVPVLTHSVTSGEVIREDDLGWKQAEGTEGILTKFEDIVGKEAKKGLHADDPLHPDDVRTIPLVRSNDIVTGIWQKGGIRITGQFKAKSDGGKGDVITLVHLTGRDQVLARVTDVHEAQIVSADAVQKTQGEDAEDANEQAGPTQTVVHKIATRQRRRRTLPVVTHAAATDEAVVPAIRPTAARETSINENQPNTHHDEPSEPSSR
jgi:flagella basal body P-ring formation protein FlgA